LEDLTLVRKPFIILKSLAVAGSLLAIGQSGMLSSPANANEMLAETGKVISNTGKAIWDTTSEFFSNLQLAAMPNLQMAEKGMSQAESGNTGLYFGANYSVARIGSYNLKYRTNAKEAWELDSNVSGSAQLGYDFGLVRLDVKAVATDGGVDTIGGAAAGNDRSNVAVATANIYWDLMRSEVADEIALVPYVGVGGGAIGFHASAKTTDAGGDHHNGIGYAATGHAGINVEVHENVGIVLGYQYVRGYGAHEEVGIHLGEIGLRLTY